MFTCRLCGGTEYAEVFGGVYRCTSCSIIFADPGAFSSSKCKSTDGEVDSCMKAEVNAKPMMGEKGPLRFVKEPNDVIQAVKHSAVVSDVREL